MRAAETNRARQTRDEARNRFYDAKRKREDEERELRRLYDPEWFGGEGQWKQLENKCFSKDTGECVAVPARRPPRARGMLTRCPGTSTRCACSARRRRSRRTAGATTLGAYAGTAVRPGR